MVFFDRIRLIVRILQPCTVRTSHKENPTGFGHCCQLLIDLFGPFTPTCHGIDIKGTSQSRPAKWVVRSISARSTRGGIGESARSHQSYYKRSFAPRHSEYAGLFDFRSRISHPFLVNDFNILFLPALYQGLSLN